MTDEISGLATSIQANEDIIKGMLRFGNLYPDDECIVLQQNLLQTLRTKHDQRVSEFSSLSLRYTWLPTASYSP
ncbi:hypothetical protein TNCV_4240701 [Trichonephila clavipes]|nr:hypothetical protein TNCV_4240701 [Trichonephila clavipes]